MRSSLRYASKKHWSSITKARRAGLYSPAVEAAEARFSEFDDIRGDLYPAITRLWRSSWELFTPFPAFPPESRKIIYIANAIESLNARFRQAARRRGHFPNELAALKVLYLVVRSPQRNRTNVIGRTHGWKAALGTLTMFYGDRITLN